jgi:hypothetical protein
MSLDERLSSFDPEFAGPSAWAAMYRLSGLQVIPSYLPSEASKGQSWKRPKLAEWATLQKELVPDTSFDRWYGANGAYAQRDNMGILTGSCSGNIFVIDLDTPKGPEADRWWQATLAEHNNGIEPETWQQRTGGGGRQLLFRAPPGKVTPTNRTPLNVDIRGEGGFAVMPSSLHESGRRYEWLPGMAPYEIEIADAPDWLLDAVDFLVARYGGSEAGKEKTERTASPEHDFDAFGNREDGREDYMTRVVWGAVVDMHRQCPIKPTEAEQRRHAEAAYEIYERNVTTRITGIDKRAGLEREGRGHSEFWRKWQYAMRQWDSHVAEAAKEDRPNSAPEGPPASEPPPPVENVEPIPIRSAFPISESAIPPRDWISPGLLLKRNLSVLVAPPGSGKSLLTLQWAIMISLGMDWAGWHVRAPQKVLVINSEDDIDEMRRRLVASVQKMGVDQHHLAGRIMLADAPETIVIAKADNKSKTVIRTPLLERLVETIKQNGIGCIIVDPFAETFEGDENSNSEVKWAGILWREVARRTNTSVMLVHHTKKYAGGMAGDADASRGGGALIGTARTMSTLFAMTADEAEAMSIAPEDRVRYVRFDDAKGNHNLMTGRARWFEKVSVQLNNGVGMIPGDSVGALIPWKPPGLMDEFTIEQLNRVLDVIDFGQRDEDGKRTGQLYGAHHNSKSYAGKVVSEHLACDDAKARKILSKWLETGVLEVVEYVDPETRHKRNGVQSNLQKRPGKGETSDHL